MRTGHSKKGGFTLPTVVIASVVMLAVLAVTLQLVASTSSALRDRYYNQLAREAAEAGATKANACIVESGDPEPSWSSASPLRPNTDCNGTVISGQSAYVVGGANDELRTTFTVAGLENEVIAVEGVLEQYRPSDNTVWRTLRHTLNAQGGGEMFYATSVSSGLYQVCAILSEETWCNGGNQSGQMGNGRVEPIPSATEPNGVLYKEPERVLRQPGVLEGRTDKMVVSGMRRACTVTTDNEIFCWGHGGYGSLGVGYPQTGNIPLPTRVAKPAGMTGEITGIATGFQSTCAISGGDLWCWGQNDYGQIGDNTLSDRYAPVRAHNIGTHAGRPVTDVASSPYSYSFCAVAGGDAYCWGHNNYGQLGNGPNTQDRRVPTAVAKQSGRLAGKTVSKVVMAYSYRSTDGSLTIADGTGGTNNHCTPSNPDCYKGAFACALTTNGEMYCWGSNKHGELGQGSWSIGLQHTPIRVGGLLQGKTVRDIATSYWTPCALTTEPDTGDRLYCWGRNHGGAGAVGHNRSCRNDSSMCSPTPIVMATPGLANKYIDSISAGVNRMCAIAEGVSYCAGINQWAQLGDGTTTNRNVPTEATLLRQFRPALVF